MKSSHATRCFLAIGSGSPLAFHWQVVSFMVNQPRSGAAWTEVALADLLPVDAFSEIESLAGSGLCDISALKKITNRYRDILLSKGVDADYLAYAILFMLGKH